jgi:DNA-binding PadR family transcriptional regulator
LGEFEELVLLSVRQLGDEAHGASVQEVLAGSAAREVTLGAIYSALDRAQRKGLADSWLGEPTAIRGGRAKRHYRVTEEGEAALEESRRIRELLWAQPGEARP